VGLLIDTDLLIDLERGTTAPEAIIGDHDCAISVITVSELLHGVLRSAGATRALRRAFVEHLLGGLQAIPISEPVARVRADVWSELSERGEPIGAHDLWIAATAIAHGLTLATRNSSHFERVPGLRLARPPA
jgi:predicted nucleic acid-binding protein